MKFLHKQKLVITIIIFVVIIFSYFYHIEGQWLHDDEHAWTRRGVILFQEYFLLHFKSPIWQEYISYDMPTLGEFFFGAATTFIYKSDWRTLLSRTQYTANAQITDNDHFEKGFWWVDNRYLSDPLLHIPKQYHDAFHIIIINRYVSAAFGVGALLLFFLIGKKIFGYWVSVIGILLLSQHPIFYAHSRHALLDVIFVFFELGTFLFFLKVMSPRRLSGIPCLSDVVLLGVFSGLLLSIKLNGFMFLPIIFITIILLKCFGLVSSMKARTLLSIVGTTCVVSLTVFYLLNPFVWSNPVAKLQYMYSERLLSTADLMHSFPSASYPSMFNRPRMLTQSLLMPDGCCAALSRFLPYVDLFLFIVGCVLLYKKMSKDSMIFSYTCWTLFIIISLILYLPLNFDKYFLPVIPFLLLVEALGLYLILDSLIKKLNIHNILVFLLRFGKKII